MQPFTPPANTGTHATTAVPLLGASKQSHASSQPSIVHTLAPPPVGTKQVTEPGCSGVADQLQRLFIVSGPSLHAFHSPGGLLAHTGAPLVVPVIDPVVVSVTEPASLEVPAVVVDPSEPAEPAEPPLSPLHAPSAARAPNSDNHRITLEPTMPRRIHAPRERERPPRAEHDRP